MLTKTKRIERNQVREHDIRNIVDKSSEDKPNMIILACGNAVGKLVLVKVLNTWVQYSTCTLRKRNEIMYYNSQNNHNFDKGLRPKYFKSDRSKLTKTFGIKSLSTSSSSISLGCPYSQIKDIIIWMFGSTGSTFLVQVQSSKRSISRPNQGGRSVEWRLRNQ